MTGMIFRVLNKSCRRCGAPVHPTVGRGRPRVYCTDACSTAAARERRLLRHEQVYARSQLDWNSKLAAAPAVPGLATPEHAASEARRWAVVLDRVEADLRRLAAPFEGQAS